ncbi:hypothetical protein PFZ55_04615 [Streptomyces sp. MS2A]|nr:hypothetical protein [Streptomyces sp. MS2A]
MAVARGGRLFLFFFSTTRASVVSRREAMEAAFSYDRAWCVLDVAEFAHLDEALHLAVDEDVQVVLSKPVFRAVAPPSLP